MKKWFLNIIHYNASKLFVVLITVITGIIIINLLFPLPKMKEYSKVILDRDGKMLSAYLTSDDKWRLETNLEDIAPEMIKAIITKEDRWFYWHLGVNPVSIGRAFYQNIISGKRVSGASTITMQLARMIEPAERTYLNKILEILRAIQLEFNFSKDEILEMYLSYLPMGGNIEGVRSASYIYFNRPPNKLSLAQSVSLSVIPTNPNKYRIDKSTKELILYRNYWLNQFLDRDIFDENIVSLAIEEYVISQRFNIPVNAPHFCYEVKSRSDINDITTTLDGRVQSISENILANHIQNVRGKGINNGAVLVINNKTNEVLAYCGSSDFFDAASQGQVNGVKAVRSPGSALKPFVYAAALDNGSFTPKMKLLDIPTDYAGYSPENYDQTFNGEVTFHAALVNSLNVPAVRLLQEVGFNRFLFTMSKLGFENIWQQRNKMGLSLILGGCGVTLEHITQAYSCFANKGALRSLKYIADEYSNSSKEIYSEEAAFIISNILSSNERPDFPNWISEATKLPKIAWKTGTSYGKRDAWAIGYNTNYTIGVWVGNFDGKGSVYLNGKEIAVPLLFNLFNSIDYDSDDDWFVQPRNVGVRKVCENTGFLPNDNCSSATNDFFIWDVSQENKCKLFREVYVNNTSTRQYCVECLPLDNYAIKQYKYFKPELINWYTGNNIDYEEPPAHNPNCTTLRRYNKPVIISPAKQTEYFLELGSDQKILLQASSEIDVSKHFWYINNKYFGKTDNSGKLFFAPIEGKNKIVCKNDLGAETRMQIVVNYF